MIISDLQKPPLSHEQWELITSLADTLTPHQTAWVSGYFAGLDRAARTAAIDPAKLHSPPAATTRAGAKSQAGTITVLYGSETGNSAEVARILAERGKAQGLEIVAIDMADYKPRRLKDEQDVLVVTSTYGEGDPPQPAAGFFEFVEGRRAPSLTGLRYAVLALGDSTYKLFCEAGKRLDRRFEDLGATRLHPRVDCDVDYEERAAAWTSALLARLAQDNAAPAEPVARGLAPSPATSGRGYDKRNPFPAEIIENLVLTGRGSTKETRHIELSLQGSGLAFQPGDALGVMPRNDPRLVEQLLDALILDPAAPLALKTAKTMLADALQSAFEITTATPRFLQHWAELTGAADLKRLSRQEFAPERAAFLRGHHVIDIVRLFPMPGLEAKTFVAGLRPLQPRLYSIASSLATAPDEVHLTVATVRYHLHAEARSGVASGQFAERGDVGSRLPVFVQVNPHFCLPADDVPILMVGAGTGVAPFRAFMQEREARGASGRSWLVFGERNFRTDFLYQIEWQQLLRDGTLSRMDVAFSRDRIGKAYVQHRLREQARDVFRWIEDGAHVYVCGDAARLAPDVHEALVEIVQQEGAVGRDEADEYMRNLQRDGRYQRDVY
jgi:sulfite reductase (NADPH) flavoprotein alpha-component